MNSGHDAVFLKLNFAWKSHALVSMLLRVISKIENPQIVLLILLELPLGTLRYQKKIQLDI